jgi:hypothetical protein
MSRTGYIRRYKVQTRPGWIHTIVHILAYLRNISWWILSVTHMPLHSEARSSSPNDVPLHFRNGRAFREAMKERKVSQWHTLTGSSLLEEARENQKWSHLWYNSGSSIFCNAETTSQDMVVTKWNRISTTRYAQVKSNYQMSIKNPTNYASIVGIET